MAKSIAAPLPYPVLHGDCEGILNTSHYNLRIFQDREPDRVQQAEITYVLRICESDPALKQNEDWSDVFLLRCDSQCNAAVTQNSLTYRPMNAHNFSEGVIYYGEGEPFYDADGVIRTLDLEWRVYCGDDESADTEAKFTVIDGDNMTGMVIGTIYSSAGCPTTVDTPTPSPAYEPNCGFVYRYSEEQSMGVRGDLTDLNDGPYGVKSSITIDGKNYTLFFQSCERMACPFHYDCGEEGDDLSSAWLCADGKCQSWGVAVDQPDFKPYNGDVSQGMVLTMNNARGDRSVELHLSCKEAYPDGHINWVGKGTIENQMLTVLGQTNKVCMLVLPSPTPYAEMCVFEDSGVSMDLHKLNKDGGWSKEVEVQGVTGMPPSLLMYQPCGSMVCPTGAFCHGDEDAAVWLCFDESGELLCQGYGLLENNVSMEFSAHRPEYGVSAAYRGDMRKTTQVQFMCNASLDSSEMLLSDWVRISGDEMSVIVQASSACVASPTPQPTTSPIPQPTTSPTPSEWHPPIPTPGPTASPTPNPSPNPLFVMFNDTQFVRLSLNELVQEAYTGTTKMYSAAHPSDECDTEIRWHPWDFLDAPRDAKVSDQDAGATANMWVCWVDPGAGRYCHPVGDSRVGLDIQPASESDWGYGLNMWYGGQYGLGVELSVRCSTSESQHMIPFNDDTKLLYYIGFESPHIFVPVDSAAVCPHIFVTPTTPPTPVSTPKPSGSPKYSYEATQGDTKRSVDFEEIDTVTQELIVGVDSSFERNHIIFNAAKKVPCPSGYACYGSATKANAWRCFTSGGVDNVCISMADSDFGIDYRVINTTDITQGISAQFHGGYAGSVAVHCLCDHRITTPVFDSTGDKSLGTGAVTLTLRSDSFCGPLNNTSVHSGGSIFLLILLCITLIYIAGGIVVTYVLTGVVSVPNASFWNAFATYIATSVTFIFTCGRRTYTSYETIL